MKFIALIGLIILVAIASPSTATSGTIPPVHEDRLLVIGDSLTAGLYASSENNTYARLVADATGMQLGRRYVSTLGLAIEEWQKVKEWEPSIVVLEVGLNDVSKGQYDSTWQSKYTALIRDMMSNGASVIVSTTFWGGIKTTHPNYAIYLALNESIRNAAQQTGATLADAWAATFDCAGCVSNEDDDSYWGPHYHGDNFHPNDTGHRLIADTVLDAFRHCACDPNAPDPLRYFLAGVRNE